MTKSTILRYPILLYILFFVSSNLLAQKKIEYINPPGIQSADYSIDLEDIVSEEDYCKFRLVVKNKTEQYMAFDLSKVGFDYGPMGVYYPKKGKMKVIPPNSRILETIKIDGNMNYMVDNFGIKLEGLQFVLEEATAITEEAKLVEKTSQSFGNFDYLVKKAYQKKGKFTFVYNIEYTGPKSEFGVIDQDLFALKNAEGKSFPPHLLPKKLKVVQKGKKLTITGDLETEESDFTIDWKGMLKNYKLSPQKVAPVQIRRFSIAAVTKTTSSPVEEVVKVQAARNQCGNYVGDVRRYPVRVAFYSEEGECFQVRFQGSYVNPNFANKVEFSSPITGKVDITMQNGETFKKSMLFNEQIYDATYKIKKNNKGKYIAKLQLGSIGSTGPTAAELAAQNTQRMKEFREKSERETLQQNEEKAKTNAANNSSSHGPTFHGTRPANSMHLVFFLEGKPLTNLKVDVFTATGFSGSGVTDSKGNVFIDASGLGSTRRISLYAKNSEVEYKLGNAVKLDDKLYAFIEPAKVMLETVNDFMKAADGDGGESLIKEMGLDIDMD